MTYLKILAISIIFFVIGYMLNFIDYVIRLVSSDTIYYTTTLFMIFIAIFIYLFKIVVARFIKFNIRDPKLLFSAFVVFISLINFYNEFYLYIIEHPFIIILFIFIAIIVSYMFITLIIGSEKKERYFFIGYFLFVIILNIVIQFLNFNYEFLFIDWFFVASKAVLLLMTYYFTAKFLVTSKSYELTMTCYATIALIFAAKSLFAIILNFS